MIDLYSGTPGSGKSLHVAQKIYWTLRIGRPVICNFEINTSVFKRSVDFTLCQNWDLSPGYLIDYSRRFFAGRRIIEDKILLVIDECQLLFNAREWSKKGRSDWLAFFTQHRKYGYHIILIAQFDGMIDKQIRALVEYEYIHRKLSNFGIRGWLLGLFLGGSSFIAVRVWYPMNQKVDHEFFHGRRRYYQLYSTYDLFDSVEAVSALDGQVAGLVPADQAEVVSSQEDPAQTVSSTDGQVSVPAPADPAQAVTQLATIYLRTMYDLCSRW